MLAADPRITGIESADYVDTPRRGGHRHHHRHPRARRRETGVLRWSAYCAGRRGRRDPDRLRLLGRPRRPTSSTSAVAAADAADRATRMLGATKPPRDRLTVVLDPWVTAQFLGILGRHAQRRGGAQGPLAVRRPPRRGGGVAAAHPRRRPDRRPVVHRHRRRRRGPGHPAQRRSSTAGVLQRLRAQRPTRPAASGTASTGSAVRGGFKSTPGGRLPGPGARARARRPPAELLAEVGDGVLIQEVSGLHSGVNPVSGDFSTGAEGLRIRGGEVAEPLREFTIASTLQRMLHDVDGRRRRPRVAADERRRRQPRRSAT